MKRLWEHVRRGFIVGAAEKAFRLPGFELHFGKISKHGKVWRYAYLTVEYYVKPIVKRYEEQHKLEVRPRETPMAKSIARQSIEEEA